MSGQSNKRKGQSVQAHQNQQCCHHGNVNYKAKEGWRQNFDGMDELKAHHEKFHHSGQSAWPFKKRSVRFVHHKTVEVDIYEKYGDKVTCHPHGEHKTLSWSAPRAIQRRRHPSSVYSSRCRRGHMNLRNVLLDRTLNVSDLEVGDLQEIHLEATDPIFLPQLKIFSWHAESSEVNYHDYDYDDDNDEDADDESPETIGSQHQQQQQSEEKFEQKKHQAVYKILMAAPNLELIKDFHFESDYAIVLAANKVHCVQHLCLFDTVNVDHLEEFLTGQPRLKILQLINHDDEDLTLDYEEADKLAEVIQHLFHLTADDLRVLDLSQFCSSVDIQIPQPLRKLYQLKIGSAKGQVQSPSRCLPKGLFDHQTFPHLCVLDCSGLLCDQDEHWNHYFPKFEHFEHTFDTVKVLVVTDRCNHFWMEKLQDLCPNFCKLVLLTCFQDGGFWTNLMMGKIFMYWTHLHYLELRLDDFPATEPLSFSLDSAFLGVDEESCEELREAAAEWSGTVAGTADHHDDLHQKHVDESHAYIASLEKLKKLDIYFEHSSLDKLAGRWPIVFGPLMTQSADDGDDDEGDRSNYRFLSPISCRHGFSRLPDLKVEVMFDQNCPWGKELAKQLQHLDCPKVSVSHIDDACCSLRNPHHRHLAGVRGSGGEMGIRTYGYP